jgi:hypothetical protein
MNYKKKLLMITSLSLFYKFLKSKSQIKLMEINNNSNLENNRKLFNDISSFSYSNQRPKLLIINSEIPGNQIINYPFLPNDLEIYDFNCNNQKNSNSLLNIMKYYSNNIYNSNKKFDFSVPNLNIAISPYGDIKKINYHSLIKEDKELPIFERLNILTKKENILNMKERDFILLYCSNEEKNKISYSLNEFVIFRYMFRKTIKNLNVNFYVKIPNYYIDELNNLENNNKIYIVQRTNSINQNEKLINLKDKKIIIDNQEFSFIDITDDILNEINNYKKSFMKILINKGNFFYYIYEKLTPKNLMEMLNLFFPKNGYYSIICNLFYPEHKNQIIKFISEYKNNLNIIENNNSIILNDHYNNKYEKIQIYQGFKKKYFDLTKYSLKDVEIKEEIPFYKKRVMKKKIIDINNLKWFQDKDITFDKNSYFSSYKF